MVLTPTNQRKESNDMNTFKHAIRESFNDVVLNQIEDFYNAEDYEYKPLYNDRNELAEAVWKYFVKYNPEGVRFIGKEPAMTLIRKWMAKEEDISNIVKFN